MAIAQVGLQKAQLTLAASSVAERIALADVSEGEVSEIANSALRRIGLEEADFDFGETAELVRVQLAIKALGSFRIEAVGVAAKELG